MVGVMGWGVTDDKGWRKGPWTPEEDRLLTEYISLHGEGRWSSVARSTGLSRNGKSCRLRWVNYLRPGLKRGQITPQEEGIIIELHALWGNKWSTIARYLPGRTDNEIKNYWRTHFKTKERPSQKQAKRKTNDQAVDNQLQQQEEAENHMNKISLSPQGESNNKRIRTELQSRQENDFTCPISTTTGNTTEPVIYQDVASWLDSVTEDGFWGSLWNLDNTNTAAANHDQSTIAYSCGANTSDLNNCGYIF